MDARKQLQARRWKFLKPSFLNKKYIEMVMVLYSLDLSFSNTLPTDVRSAKIYPFRDVTLYI